ncbi:MAG: hypothetical protein ACKVP7_17330 [Hyphomicrobiaceae bacterium]
MSDVSDWILLAYGACNSVRVISYLPQIICVARDRHGARAISLSTWWMWIAANATTALYAWVNLGDATLAILNAMNTVCCLIVVTMTTCKRFASANPTATTDAA